MRRKPVFSFVVRFPLSVGFEALLFGLFVVVLFHRAGLLALRQPIGWEVCSLKCTNSLVFCVLCCASPLRIVSQDNTEVPSYLTHRWGRYW